MNDELGILISSRLDTSNKTIQDLNNDLKNIQKSLDGLDINIDTSKMTKQIQELNKNLEQTASKIGSGSGGIGNQITKSMQVDIKDVKSHYEKAYKEIVSAADRYGGQIKSITKDFSFDEDGNEQVKKYVAQLKTAENEIKQISFKPNELFESGFEEEVRVIDKMGEVAEKSAKEMQGLADAMGKGRENSLAKQQQEQEKLAKTQAKYSNKAIDDAYKQSVAEKKTTEELEHQIQKAQQLARIRVQNLERRYGSVLTTDDRAQMQSYINGMDKITSSTPNAKRAMDNLNLGIRQVEANVSSAGSKVNRFGENLREALTRVPVWINNCSDVNKSL